MAEPLIPVDVFSRGRNIIEHADEVDTIITAVNKKLPQILDPNNDSLIEVALPLGTNRGALLEAAHAFRKYGWHVTIVFEDEYEGTLEPPLLVVGIN